MGRIKTMLYELTFLISSGLNETEIKEFSEKLNKIVADKAKNSEMKTLKKIALAYPVKKQKEAFFGSLDFEAEKETIKTIKQEVEKMPEIIRYLLIQKIVCG